MKKILNLWFIISVLVIIYYAAIYVYEEWILPRKYISSGTLYEVVPDDEAELVKKITIKYLTLSQDVSKLNSFIPASVRSDEKTKNYLKNIAELKFIKIVGMNKLDGDVYRVKYNIFESGSNNYELVVKLYRSKNYFKILYDELYDAGRKIQV